LLFDIFTPSLLDHPLREKPLERLIEIQHTEPFQEFRKNLA